QANLEPRLRDVRPAAGQLHPRAHHRGGVRSERWTWLGAPPERRTAVLDRFPRPAPPVMPVMMKPKPHALAVLAALCLWPLAAGAQTAAPQLPVAGYIGK